MAPNHSLRQSTPMIHTASRYGMLVALLVYLPAAAMAQPGTDKFPPELVKFVPLRQEPVFAAAPGKWDAMIRERGWIMREDGVWKMWYTGYADRKGPLSLGYATSKDGISWTRHAGNPLYKEHWVEDM